MAQTNKLTETELDTLMFRVSRGEKLTEAEIESLKEPLRRSLRDGSFQRRVYEAARPAIEADDLAIRSSCGDKPGQRAL